MSKYTLGRKKHYDSQGNITYSDRDYISYSAWSLWKRNKDEYRKRYYENEPSYQNAETIFGKEIGRMMELEDVSVHPILSKVPNYKIKEQPLEVEIEGCKVIGYLDQFDPDRLKILEMKTGHLDKEGKVPWDKVKVRKHDQLPFYSMLVKEQYGKVDNVCHLIWIETEFKENTVEFDGHTLKAKGRELCLTGRVKKFRRVIREFERKRIREDLIKTINEIKTDYEQYKSTRSN